MHDLDVPAARFARFLAANGLPVQHTVAFAGLSTLAVVDTSALTGAGADLGVAKGLAGYYHVIESMPPDVQPGVYGYYWYKRFGAGKHKAWRDAFAFEYETLTRMRGQRGWVEVWAGDLDAEIPYYVMRYYPAGSLAARGAATGWKLAPSFVVAVATDVASALAELHARGVVHRDLNAENVLLDEDGGAVVADLGCARDLRAAPVEPRTRPDEFHWPPEYADAYDTAGVEADIYALGVLMYQMAVGRMPRYRGPACAAAAPAGRFPAAVVSLADACLEYRPEDRPASMDAVLAQLAST